MKTSWVKQKQEKEGFTGKSSLECWLFHRYAEPLSDLYIQQVSSETVILKPMLLSKPDWYMWNIKTWAVHLMVITLVEIKDKPQLYVRPA